MPDKGETFIRLHDSMPDNHKIAGLSDKAFRLLVETWCWCSRQRNEGRFPVAAWHRLGTARTRAELERSRLVMRERDLIVIHDFLYWQRSNDEVTELSAKRRQAGARGNHIRWHVGKDVTDPACEFCQEGRGNGVASGIASGIASGARNVGISDRKSIADRTEKYLVRGDLDSSSPVDQRARDLEAFEKDRFGKGLSLRSFKIAEDYARTCVQRPARSWLNQLGAKIDELIDSNWTDEQITDAVRELGKRGLAPSLLPSVANERVNSDKANDRPRNVREIPDDQLTEADVAEILGPADHDPDLPIPPDEAATSLKGLREWRKSAFPEFHRKRRERAIEVRRQRLARSGGRPE